MVNTRHLLISLFITLLMTTYITQCSAEDVEGSGFDLLNLLSSQLNSDMFVGSSENADAPKVVWPSKFSVKFTTDKELLYNVTAAMRIDSPNNKLWTQLNYTSPFFGTDEAFQLAMFPGKKNVSLKIDDECRWAYVNDIRYLYLNLIFNSWSLYTEYKGRNEDNLHIFQLSQYIQKLKVANLTFLFKDMGEGEPVQLEKVGVTSSSLGVFYLRVIEPVTEQNFTDADFNFGEVL